MNSDSVRIYKEVRAPKFGPGDQVMETPAFNKSYLVLGVTLRFEGVAHYDHGAVAVVFEDYGWDYLIRDGTTIRVVHGHKLERYTEQD